MRARNAILALVFAASCASSSAPRRACETLFFGTGKPDGSIVTEREWAAFANEVLTREFPDGLTSWEAAGQWRGGDGRIVAEHSHVVFVYGASDAAIERVIAEYKKRFAQEAVMRVSAPCAARF